MWALTFLHLTPTDDNSHLAPLKMRVQPVALWSFHLRKHLDAFVKILGQFEKRHAVSDVAGSWGGPGCGSCVGLCLGHEIAASSPRIGWRERGSLLGVPRRVRGCRAGHEAPSFTCPLCRTCLRMCITPGACLCSGGAGTSPFPSSLFSEQRNAKPTNQLGCHGAFCLGGFR